MAVWSLRWAILAVCLQACFQTTFAEIPFVESVLKLQDYLQGGKPSHKQIHQELGTRLSANAKLITEGSDGFRESTLRWQEFRPPTFAASVEVASEQDIQETVSIADV